MTHRKERDMSRQYPRKMPPEKRRVSEWLLQWGQRNLAHHPLLGRIVVSDKYITPLRVRAAISQPALGLTRREVWLRCSYVNDCDKGRLVDIREADVVPPEAWIFRTAKQGDR